MRKLLAKLGAYLVALSSAEEKDTRSVDGRRASAKSGDGRARRHKSRDGGPATMVAASVQFVGLDEVRRDLGEAWPSVARTVYMVAEEAICRHLSQRDTYRRHGEDSFILCFASADKSAAEAKTQAIAHEIRELVAARLPQSKLDVEQTVAEVEWVDVEDDTASVFETIAATLRKVRNEASEVANAWRRYLINTATVRYSAVWRPNKQAVVCYRVLLSDETGKHAFQRLEAMSSPEEVQNVMFDLDCLMLGRAIASLHRLLDRGGSIQVIIPVNYATLHQRSYREQYLKLCLDIPASYKKFIIFHLHGAMSGAPASRIGEIGTALSVHAHAVLVDVSAEVRRIQEFQASCFRGVAINATSLPGHVPEATRCLAQIMTGAKAAGLNVFVHGADTVGLISAAVDAQVDFVEGRGLAVPPVEELKSVHRRNLAGRVAA
jgi:hypothetical protein